MLERYELFEGKIFYPELHHWSNSYFGGIDLGPASCHEILDHISDGQNGWWVFRIKGHNSWAGIGMTAYYETGYYLIKVDKDFRVQKSFKGEFGKQWRKGINEIIKIIEAYDTIERTTN